MLIIIVINVIMTIIFIIVSKYIIIFITGVNIDIIKFLVFFDSCLLVYHFFSALPKWTLPYFIFQACVFLRGFIFSDCLLGTRAQIG